jgi:hypothetical protein
MSDGNYEDNIGELVKAVEPHAFRLFSFVNLKIFFVVLLVCSFLFMMLGKNSHTSRRRRLIRRNFSQVWNDEKKQKFKELTKKSVDIKDFSKYRPSDIENITLLNTLINAYISKVYEELVSRFPSLDDISPKSTTDNTESVVTNAMDESKSSANDIKMTASEENQKAGDHTNIVPGLDDASLPETSEVPSASTELEQGSHVDSSLQANFTDAQDKVLSSSRKRSILKSRKNV